MFEPAYVHVISNQVYSPALYGHLCSDTHTCPGQSARAACRMYMTLSHPVAYALFFFSKYHHTINECR